MLNRPAKKCKTSVPLGSSDETSPDDHWFREQVEAALKEAGDISTDWVSNEAAMAEFAKRRADLRVRASNLNPNPPR